MFGRRNRAASWNPLLDAARAAGVAPGLSGPRAVRYEGHAGMQRLPPRAGAHGDNDAQNPGSIAGDMQIGGSGDSER